MFGPHEPLNLALLAAFIRSKGFNVDIADELAGESTIQKYNYFKPDIIGVTSSSYFIQEAYKIARYFKEKKVPTILGGIHATICTDDAASNFDMVVKGEGELPILRILSEGHDRGIFFTDQPIDINQMPLPARDLLRMDYYSTMSRRFPHWGAYVHFPVNAKVLATLISRGCPWPCAFCHNSSHELPFRIYSPDKVVQELTFLKEQYGVKYFVFEDDNIFTNKNKIKEILSGIARSGLNMKWIASARVDGLDEEIVDLAKQSGCVKLTFGFETGSQRMLDEMKKKAKVEDAYEVVKLCRKYKIKVGGFFMVGFPNEEVADVLQTRNLIKKLRLDNIIVSIATAFPATQWWKIAQERKLVPERIEWDKFSFRDVPIKINQVFSIKQLNDFQLKYYFDFYWVNPKCLWRMVVAALLNFEPFARRIQEIVRFNKSSA